MSAEPMAYKTIKKINSTIYLEKSTSGHDVLGGSSYASIDSAAF